MGELHIGGWCWKHTAEEGGITHEEGGTTHFDDLDENPEEAAVSPEITIVDSEIVDIVDSDSSTAVAEATTASPPETAVAKNTSVRPYSLENVLLAPAHFRRQFFVLVYLAADDELTAYFPSKDEWYKGDGRMRTCDSVLARAFGRLYNHSPINYGHTKKRTAAEDHRAPGVRGGFTEH